jgi:cytochrome c2
VDGPRRVFTNVDRTPRIRRAATSSSTKAPIWRRRTGAEEVVEIAFAEVYAAADAGAGERLWRQCQACHALNPAAMAWVRT